MEIRFFFVKKIFLEIFIQFNPRRSVNLIIVSSLGKQVKSRKRENGKGPAAFVGRALVLERRPAERDGRRADPPTAQAGNNNDTWRMKNGRL